MEKIFPDTSIIFVCSNNLSFHCYVAHYIWSAFN